MKAMERIGVLLGVFAFSVGTWYGLWTRWSEPVGPTGLYLGGLLGFMIAGYLAITRRKLAVDPSDDPVADVADVQGDYGFFSPHSWWPLWLAGSAAVMFAGLAVGWWLFIIGAFVAVPALIGWTFEYFRGPHAL